MTNNGLIRKWWAWLTFVKSTQKGTSISIVLDLKNFIDTVNTSVDAQKVPYDAESLGTSSVESRLDKDEYWWT
jgi:hypothetical protein